MPALAPASLTRLISSLTARATTGTSNESSGIQARRAGCEGVAGFAAVAGAGGGSLAHAIPTPASNSDPTNIRLDRVGSELRPVAVILN